MGEEIEKYPIHDRLYTYIKSCNGQRMYYGELCKQIEAIKLSKTEIEEVLTDAFKRLGLTDRQIEMLSSKAGIISMNIRFNRQDTRQLIRDMHRLGMIEVNHKIVTIK